MPRKVAIALALALSAGIAGAQSANIGFGGIRADTSLPVEVKAEEFSVNQTDGTAVFSGNVVIAQGDMRISAAEVTIRYATEDRNRIEQLLATGGVTLVSGPDAAEAAEAEYTIDSGTIVLRGDVLLTQGPNTLSGQTLTVDLETGTGRMEGGVKTVLQPGGN